AVVERARERKREAAQETHLQCGRELMLHVVHRARRDDLSAAVGRKPAVREGRTAQETSAGGIPARGLGAERIETARLLGMPLVAQIGTPYPVDDVAAVAVEKIRRDAPAPLPIIGSYAI